MFVCNVFAYSCQVGFSCFQDGFHGFSWFQVVFLWFNDNVDKPFVKELQTIPHILKLYI